MSDGINFAWYLTVWLTAHFGDERSFWKTATPARCDMLFKEYARMVAPRKKAKEPECSGSLSQYLMGGG